MQYIEEVSHCLSCRAFLPVDTFDVVCSASCREILDFRKRQMDAQWDYDPEEALYA